MHDDDDDEDISPHARDYTVKVNISRQEIWIDGPIGRHTAADVLKAFHKIEEKVLQEDEEEMAQAITSTLRDIANGDTPETDLKVVFTDGNIDILPVGEEVPISDEGLAVVELEGGPIEVTIYMNTPGGSPYQAFPICDFLENARDRFKVKVVVYGSCMSAGTLILASAEEKVSFPSTLFLVHGPSTEGIGGGPDEVLSASKTMTVLRENILDLYLRNTKLTKAQASKFLRNETYFNSADAVRYGFVDRVDIS